MPPSPSGLLRRFFGSAVSNAAGYAVGGAIQPVLEPVTQDLANEAWNTHPVKPLPAGTAARAAAEGVMSEAEAESEARLTGYGDERWATLRQLANEYPTTGQLLDLLNRGVVTVAQVRDAMAHNAIPDNWQQAMLELRTYLVPPSDLVRMAVREVFDPAKRDKLDLDAEFPTAFLERAALVGMTDQVARDFWAAHWELPSLTEGAAMYFRGLISEQDFEGLAAALDYAPVWRAPLLETMRPIPSLTDMITMAVREVYDPAKRARLGLDDEFPEAFAQQAALHGFSRQHAMDEWAKHWRLPSATQGYQMLWRAQIDEAELDGLLKALDYPTIWRDRLRNIAYHVPGRIDLRRMYAAGLIDRPRVVRGYRELGYNAENAELMADFTVQLAQTSPAGTPWADRARSRLFTVTHDEYLDGSLDEAGARQSLDLIGVSAAEQDTIFPLWDRENATMRKELTDSQVKKAYTKGLWTQAEAIDALTDRGLTADDATTFLES